MDSTHERPEQTPPDCFTLEALEALRQMEGAVVQDIHYFIFKNQPPEGTPGASFLFAILLLGEDRHLLLSSGEDSAALRPMDGAGLTAVMQQLCGGENLEQILRVSAAQQPLWAPLMGQMLNAVEVSRHENGLYRNDALQLDFGEQKIIIALSDQEGMRLLSNN